MGHKISVITHLSDNGAQTLCKILFLIKSGMKVWYFFPALDNAGARIIRQPVHDSPATDIGSVIRHSNVWDTHTHTELGLAPSFEYPARSITTNQIRFPYSGKLVLQLVTTRRDKQDKRPFLYTFNTELHLYSLSSCHTDSSELAHNRPEAVCPQRQYSPL